MSWRSLRRLASVIPQLWAVPAVAVLLLSTATPTTAQTHGDSVWVNTHSGVYHCPGTHSYGTSKQGQYMPEAIAVSRGFRPAKGSSCGAGPAAASGAARRPPTSASPSETRVWVNTGSHVYRCPGAKKYGTGKHGVYMTEEAALAAGNTPAHGRRCR